VKHPLAHVIVALASCICLSPQAHAAEAAPPAAERLHSLFDAEWRLGYEIGLYEDPYSRFGALTYGMWRAVRLVVDTGMHYMGWSRQQAIDYFLANAAKTEVDIVNEVDRYIDNPGQALAYKAGQMKLSELRLRAEETLSSRFDVRAFHDEVLSRGALPLDLLEEYFDAWLAAELRTDGGAGCATC